MSYAKAVESNLEVPPGRPVDWQVTFYLERKVCVHAETAFEAMRKVSVRYGVEVSQSMTVKQINHKE